MLPLAERLRPRTLDQYLGQRHLVGEGAVLRRSVESGNIPSIIFWGPPGVGKTTLAGIIASELKRPFYSLSAINSGVKEVRDVIEQARANKFFNSPPPILFIDEIHRFSKSQQDSLLGAVEKGVVTLIGATTENPSFEVIPALLSRCQVYILQHLDKEVLISLIDTALKEDEYLKKLPILIEEYDAILQFSGGDARKLLNIIELVANFQRGETVLKVNNEMVVELLQQNIALYDKNGEQHYDIISAFIKSMRGSDPNAAVYWLARMLEGGEDILFIARRMIILAAEDIGMANPNALLLANTCFQTCHQVGMPEARIILSQTAVYLATSAKSNSAYMAIEKAIELVRKTGNLPVPLPLRNAPTQLMKNINYGKGYQYAHDHPGNFVELEFLPDEISGTTLYQPANNPAEATVLQRLIFFWKKKYGY
jgi:putative ATPase